VRIAERIEQAMKRGKIEGSAMDSRTMMEMTLNVDEQDAS